MARDGATLVFVEVKAKAGTSCGTAREAVTPRKRRKVISMASDYLAKHCLDASGLRFDVVAVTITDGQQPMVEVIPNAFTLNDC